MFGTSRPVHETPVRTIVPLRHRTTGNTVQTVACDAEIAAYPVDSLGVVDTLAPDAEGYLMVWFERGHGARVHITNLLRLDMADGTRALIDAAVIMSATTGDPSDAVRVAVIVGFLSDWLLAAPFEVQSLATERLLTLVSSLNDAVFKALTARLDANAPSAEEAAAERFAEGKAGAHYDEPTAPAGTEY